jgi:hypothetical protein
VVKEGSSVLTKLSGLVRILTTAQCRARQQRCAACANGGSRRRRNMTSPRRAAVARSSKGQNLENCHPWQQSSLSAATRQDVVVSSIFVSSHDKIQYPYPYTVMPQSLQRSRAQLVRGVNGMRGRVLDQRCTYWLVYFESEADCELPGRPAQSFYTWDR